MTGRRGEQNVPPFVGLENNNSQVWKQFFCPKMTCMELICMVKTSIMYVYFEMNLLNQNNKVFVNSYYKSIVCNYHAKWLTKVDLPLYDVQGHGHTEVRVKVKGKF